MPILLLLLSCGDEEEEPACPEDSVLDWSNFGEPFARTWCTGCHASGVGTEDRQGAPLGVDLDTLAGVRDHADAVRRRAVEERTMPPGGGPDDEARALLAEWLACGAPGEDGPPIDTPPDTDPPDPGCAREGRFVLRQATCNGNDVTAQWTSYWTSTELVAVAGDGTCDLEYRLSDAGCTEVQQWRSTLESPSAVFDFLGTTTCEPAGCSFANIPTPCTVAPDLESAPIGVTELVDGALSLGPFDPPDVPFCDAIGLVLEPAP